MNRLQARVKESCTWATVQSAGQEWIKGEWRPVPDAIAAEVKDHDLLETRAVKISEAVPWPPEQHQPKAAKPAGSDQSEFTSEAAEQYAREWDLAPSAIKGSGADGKIKKSDIDAVIKATLKKYKTTKAVLKFAVENGVDLAQVEPTGKNGVIQLEDVKNAADLAASDAATASKQGQEDENTNNGGGNGEGAETDAQEAGNKGGAK